MSETLSIAINCYEAEHLADWHEAEARAIQRIEPAQVDALVCAQHGFHTARAAELRAYALRWRQVEGVPSMASEGAA